MLPVFVVDPLQTILCFKGTGGSPESTSRFWEVIYGIPRVKNKVRIENYC